MDYEPIAVGLKFGFIAVLYLFLLWIARSALKDLRRTATPAPDATGLHSAMLGSDGGSSEDAWLVAERGGGLKAGRPLRPLRGALDRPLGRGRRPDRGSLCLRPARQDLLAWGPLLCRGPQVDQRHACSTTQPLGGEAELMDGRPDPDRRHRVSLRAGQVARTMLQSRRTGLPHRHRAASAAPTRTPTTCARRSSSSPTGWAAPRRARSPRGWPPRHSTATSAREPPEAMLREAFGSANREIHEHARRGRQPRRDGDDAHRGDRRLRERRGGDRPRRRQPRLPAARRQARAADPGPLAGRGAAPQGPAHRRSRPRSTRSARSSPGRSGPRPRSSPTSHTVAGPPRRRLSDLLRRPDDDARRGPDRAAARRRPPASKRGCGR